MNTFAFPEQTHVFHRSLSFAPPKAVVLLSKAELENAPALDDRRDRANAAGSPTGASSSPSRQ